MTAADFLCQPATLRLGLTLLHFLWQGLAVAALAALAVRALALRAGPPRYAAYLAALLALAACPVATFWLVDAPALPHPADPQAAVAASANIPTPPPAPAPQPPAAGPEVSVAPPPSPAPPAPPAPTAARYTPGPAAATDPPPLEPAAAATTPPPPAPAPEVREDSARTVLLGFVPLALPWITACWIAGVCGLSLRLCLGAIGTARWRRQLLPPPAGLGPMLADLAARMRIPALPRLFLSLRVPQPVVVGYLRPLILLPATMLTGLSDDMLRAILAHELAHIRRLDLWVNLLQRLAETLLFYHPAVWWISGRLRSQRELCCDELAVEATGEPLAYATTLERAYAAGLTRAGSALALGAGRMPTLARIKHILGLAPSPTRSRWWLAGAFALLLLLALAIALPLACGPDPSAPAATTPDAPATQPGGPLESPPPLAAGKYVELRYTGLAAGATELKQQAGPLCVNLPVSVRGERTLVSLSGTIHRMVDEKGQDLLKPAAGQERVKAAGVYREVSRRAGSENDDDTWHMAMLLAARPPSPGARWADVEVTLRAVTGQKRVELPGQDVPLRDGQKFRIGPSAFEIRRGKAAQEALGWRPDPESKDGEWEPPAFFVVAARADWDRLASVASEPRVEPGHVIFNNVPIEPHPVGNGLWAWEIYYLDPETDPLGDRLKISGAACWEDPHVEEFPLRLRVPLLPADVAPGGGAPDPLDPVSWEWKTPVGPGGLNGAGTDLAVEAADIANPWTQWIEGNGYPPQHAGFVARVRSRSGRAILWLDAQVSRLFDDAGTDLFHESLQTGVASVYGRRVSRRAWGEPGNKLTKVSAATPNPLALIVYPPHGQWPDAKARRIRMEGVLDVITSGASEPVEVRVPLGGALSGRASAVRIGSAEYYFGGGIHPSDTGVVTLFPKGEVRYVDDLQLLDAQRRPLPMRQPPHLSEMGAPGFWVKTGQRPMEVILSGKARKDIRQERIPVRLEWPNRWTPTENLKVYAADPKAAPDLRLDVRGWTVQSFDEYYGLEIELAARSTRGAVKVRDVCWRRALDDKGLDLLSGSIHPEERSNTGGVYTDPPAPGQPPAIRMVCNRHPSPGAIEVRMEVWLEVGTGEEQLWVPFQFTLPIAVQPRETPATQPAGGAEAARRRAERIVEELREAVRGPNVVEVWAADWGFYRPEPGKAAENIYPRLREVAEAAVPALVQAIRDGQRDHDENVRLYAAYALRKLGPAAAPAMSAALKDNNSDVRWAVVEALGEMGPAAADAVPALIAAIGDNSGHGIAKALGQIGAAAVPALTTALKDKSLSVRISAMEALAAIGPAAKGAVPALIAAMDDKDTQARWRAAYALGKIGPEARAAIPAIVANFKHENEAVRRISADSLGDMGPAAKEAVPALVALLGDGELAVRGAAGIALSKIDLSRRESLGAIVEATGARDRYSRKNAVEALVRVCPEARTLLPTFHKITENQDDRFYGATALHAAAGSGANALVELLVAGGARVDAIDSHHRTALWYAAWAGFGDTADLLIARGANVNIVADGYTPLGLAAKDGLVTAAQLLIDRGAQVNPRAAGAIPPLQLTAMNPWASPEMAALLLARGAKLDAFSAAGLGRLEELKKSLDADKSLAAARSCELTALEFAHRRRQEAAARLLIARGAKPTVMCAAWLGLTDAVGAILKTDDEEWNDYRLQEIMEEAAIGGRNEVIELLLARGFNLKEHSAALPVAARHRRNDTVALLLARGADVNCASPRAALHWAVEYGDMQLARLLLAHKADPNLDEQYDGHGQDPLYYALQAGNKEMARLLLAGGAKVPENGEFSLWNHENKTAVRCAFELFLEHRKAHGGPRDVLDRTLAAVVQAGLSDCAETLLKMGANPEGPADRSQSLLACADEATARVLLAHGAKVDFLAACALGRTEQVKSMLAADPKLPGPGFSAISVAVANGRVEVVKLLLARGAKATGDLLATAIRANRKEMVSVPLEAGADWPGGELHHLYFALRGEGSLAPWDYRDDGGPDRKEILQLIHAHRAKRTAAAAPQLPCSDVPLEKALAQPWTFVGVCEGFHPPAEKTTPGQAGEKFRIVEVLAGQAPLLAREIDFPYTPGRTRLVRHGERVIWVAQLRDNRSDNPYDGLLCLPDTPANRQAVAAVLAKPSPATRPGGSERGEGENRGAVEQPVGAASPATQPASRPAGKGKAWRAEVRVVEWQREELRKYLAALPAAAGEIQSNVGGRYPVSAGVLSQEQARAAFKLAENPTPRGGILQAGRGGTVDVTRAGPGSQPFDSRGYHVAIVNRTGTLVRLQRDEGAGLTVGIEHLKTAARSDGPRWLMVAKATVRSDVPEGATLAIDLSLADYASHLTHTVEPDTGRLRFEMHHSPMKDSPLSKGMERLVVFVTLVPADTPDPAALLPDKAVALAPPTMPVEPPEPLFRREYDLADIVARAKAEGTAEAAGMRRWWAINMPAYGTVGGLFDIRWPERGQPDGRGQAIATQAVHGEIASALSLMRRYGPAGPAWSQAVDNLQVRLLPEREPFVAGQPVRVLLQLRNAAPHAPYQRSLMLVGPMTFTLGSASQQAPLPGVQGGISLSGGDVRGYWFDLRDLLGIKAAGQYEIRGGYSWPPGKHEWQWTGSVFSPPLRLDLAAPTTRPTEVQPAASAARPYGSRWVRLPRDPRDRGTLEDGRQIIYKGLGETDQIQFAPETSRQPSGQEPGRWFEATLKSPIELSPRTDTWLLFRSGLFNSRDQMWIERIERDGNKFTVKACTAVWQGRLYANAISNHVLAVNLGWLSPGQYEVTWSTRSYKYTALDDSGIPKDPDPSNAKTAEVKTTFTVPPATTQAATKPGRPDAVEGLRSADPVVRAKAAETAAKGRDKTAVPELIETVRGDQDGTVRVMAAIALGEIRDAGAVEALAGAIGDADWEVAYRAAEALGEIGDKRAVGPLVEALEKQLKEPTKAKFPRPMSLAWGSADNLFEQGDDLIARRMIAALGLLGDVRALPVLHKARGDERLQVYPEADDALKLLAAKGVGSGPPAAEVRVTLTAAKGAFAMGEEVVVTLRAQNVGKVPVYVIMGAHSMEAGSDHVDVQDGQGRRPEYVGGHVDEYRADRLGAQTLGAGKSVSREIELTSIRGMDRLGRWQVRGYAQVATGIQREKKEVWSEWAQVQLVTGPEVFRKDVTFTKPRPDGPAGETASFIVYGLPKGQVACYRRAVKADGGERVTYRRLAEVDPASRPEVMVDRDGELNALVVGRAWTPAEGMERFLGHPEMYLRHVEARRYTWYRTRGADGELRVEQEAPVWKTSGLTPRVVEAGEHDMELHEFAADGRDLGAYPAATAKTRPGESEESVTARMLAAALEKDRWNVLGGLTGRLFERDPEGAVRVVGPLVRRRELAHRGLVILAIGGGKHKAAVPMLIGLLGNDDPAIRGCSVEALGLIGDPSAAGPLEQMLKTVGDAATVRRIHEALGRIASATPTANPPTTVPASRPSPDPTEVGRQVVLPARGNMVVTAMPGVMRVEVGSAQDAATVVEGRAAGVKCWTGGKDAIESRSIWLKAGTVEVEVWPGKVVIHTAGELVVLAAEGERMSLRRGGVKARSRYVAWAGKFEVPVGLTGGSVGAFRHEGVFMEGRESDIPEALLRRTAAQAATDRKLNGPAAGFAPAEVTLAEALGQLESRAGAKVRADWASLWAAGVQPSARVSYAPAAGATLGQAMDAICHALSGWVQYDVETDGSILVATSEFWRSQRGKRVQKVTDSRDHAVLERQWAPTAITNRDLVAAVDLLREQQEIPIHVKWRALQAMKITPQTKVTVELPAGLTKEVMDVFTAAVGPGITWTLDEGVITISTPADRVQYQQQRTYDVRELLVPARSLVPAAEPGNAMGSWWSAKANPPGRPETAPAEATGRELADGLVATIRKRVAPDSWKPGQGDVQVLRGQCIVTQRPEVQEEVARLLTELRFEAAKQVRLDMKFLEVPIGEYERYDEFVTGPGKAGFARQGPNVWTALVPGPQADAMVARVQAGQDGRVYWRPRVNLRNGQRSYVAIRRVQSPRLPGLEGASDTEMLFTGGTMADMEAAISEDFRSVTVTARPAVARLSADSMPLETHTATASVKTRIGEGQVLVLKMPLLRRGVLGVRPARDAKGAQAAPQVVEKPLPVQTMQYVLIRPEILIHRETDPVRFPPTQPAPPPVHPTIPVPPLPPPPPAATQPAGK